jgi:large subunit ribosomal protein L15
MKLHDIKVPAGSRKPGKRKGRGPGSGNGKTAGRGHKGQKSRSGYSSRWGFEGGQMPLVRRLPKRGFTNYHRKEFVGVNIDTLARMFDAGAEVSPETLHSRGLVKKPLDGIKILARGEIDRALTVSAHRFSAEAARKIQAAGGTVTIVERRSAPAAAPEAGSEAPAKTVAARGAKAGKTEKPAGSRTLKTAAELTARADRAEATKQADRVKRAAPKAERAPKADKAEKPEGKAKAAKPPKPKKS